MIARVTRGGRVAQRYTYAPLRCRTCSTAGLLFPSECPSEMIFLTVFDGVGVAGFKSRANVFLLAYAALSLLVFYYFSLSLLSVYRLVLWAGVFGLIGCTSLSLSLALQTSFKNINNNWSNCCLTLV